MTTKLSPEHLLEAVGSLKPTDDDVINSWYVGRREQVLQRVLTGEPDDIDDSPAPSITPVVVPKWRHPRRMILTGVLAVAMVGGGAAWAYSTFAAWYTAGALNGVTCMTVWATPGDKQQASNQYGGPPLTTDPVADCNRYADLTGKSRIADPVAARWNDWLVVGPRASMPADAVPIPARPDETRSFELERSLDDYVDGGLSRCLDETSARQFARAELDRLGLSGWTVSTREQKPRSGPCALLLVRRPGVLEIRTHFGTNPAPMSSHLIAVLRSRIAEQCLSLPEAEAVANEALASNHHWPTSTQLDPGSACTRVDLNIGGSLQIFLYGPEIARR